MAGRVPVPAILSKSNNCKEGPGADRGIHRDGNLAATKGGLTPQRAAGARRIEDPTVQELLGHSAIATTMTYAPCSESRLPLNSRSQRSEQLELAGDKRATPVQEPRPKKRRFL